MAGGQGRGEIRGGRFNSKNIFQAFDDELLAEAYDVPAEIVSSLKRDPGKGFIVNLQERMQVMVPEEQEEEASFEEEGRRRFRPGSRYGAAANGFEETFCTMKTRHNIETRRESDVYSRQAGRVNIVNMHKLPILGWMDMSAERGNLLPVIQQYRNQQSELLSSPQFVIFRFGSIRFGIVYLDHIYFISK